MEGERDDAVEAAIARAAAGRVARAAMAWTGSPEAALSAAAGGLGVEVRTDALERAEAAAEAVAAANADTERRGYIVAIRQEDRERLEETVRGLRARWIGETIRWR